jgi:hypothetical protein
MSRALSFHPLKEKKAVDGRKHGARWCASKPPGSTWRLAGRVVAQCALVRQQTAGINPAARGKGCRTVRAGAPANRRDQSGGSREGLSHGARWCASKPPGSTRRLAGGVVTSNSANQRPLGVAKQKSGQGVEAARVAGRCQGCDTAPVVATPPAHPTMPRNTKTYGGRPSRQRRWGKVSRRPYLSRRPAAKKAGSAQRGELAQDGMQ